MTLQVKIIDLNNFKTGNIDDSIEESWLDFEEIRDRKGGLSNPKEFSHENWTQWEDIIYYYFTLRENSRGVPLSYVIIKDTPSS